MNEDRNYNLNFVGRGMLISMYRDLKLIVSNTYRIVNLVAWDIPYTEYSGITFKLVEERRQINMFSVPCVSAMRSKRNKLKLQLLKN
jgi:hypothetical protein